MTTKIQSPVSIIPLPDAVGWEWQNTYPEFPGLVYRHQISWSKGTSLFIYGVRVNDAPWVNTSISTPERFRFDGTVESAELVIAAFRELPDFKG